jgi:choice-of-anchor B domain-containing protein
MRPALPVLVALAALALGPAALGPPARAQPVPCVDGAAGPYACDGVDLLARLSPQDLGAPPSETCPRPYPGLCANDVWGWADPETGRQYAVVGLANGTAFVDVTTPEAPRRLGLLPTATASSSWRDVKVLGDVALVVSEARDHGMQVFDLARLRDLGEDPDRRFEADARYAGFGSAHNVVVNGETGFAYAVGSRPAAGLPASCSARGFHAVSLADPLAPAFAGCFSDAAEDVAPQITPGYTHDAQCVVYRGPDADHAGRELCLAANEDAVTVFDVVDKDDVQIVSQVTYPGAAYTHQGWLTEDQRYFVVNDELDETRAVNAGGRAPQRTLVFDVSDLDEPEFAFQYESGLATIDHNLYVVGGLAYQSNYEAGLRVVDLSDIDRGVLTEVASFDTYPEGNSVNFNGQWSNYPFFGDGLVIATDGENGLFVLRVRDAAPVRLPAPPGDGAALSAPAPNPAPAVARLALRVGADQRVRVGLYDAAGRRVRALYDGPATTDRDLPLVVRAAGLAAGVYLVRVSGETFEATRSVTLVR